MAKQVMEVGEPKTKTYGEFGMTNVNHVAPFRKGLSVVVGGHGGGKTSFFTYCSGALILNVDLHSVPRHSPDAPPCTAQFYPVIDERGLMVDASGNSIRNLKWENFLSIRDKLVKAAEMDQPRPDFIVLDSIVASLAIMKPWIAATKTNYGSWGEIPDGNLITSAYGKLYDSYIPFIMSLRDAGYGVFIVAQIINKKMKTMAKGQRSEKIVPTITVPDALWERLQPFIEMVFSIERKRVPKLNAQGTPVGFDKKWIMNNHPNELSEEMRNRVSLPDQIELPDVTTAFSTVEKAYNLASGVEQT